MNYKIFSMKKINKKLFALMTMMVLTMGMATTVFAVVAWDSFDVKLPKNNKDKEVSTVKRSSGQNSKKYFTIDLSSIGKGYTSVCAWTESSTGSNYSNPSTQVNTGSKNVNYAKVPKKGKKVVLNLDNPVKTTVTPRIKGEWTPN